MTDTPVLTELHRDETFVVVRFNVDGWLLQEGQRTMIRKDQTITFERHEGWSFEVLVKE